MKKLRINNLFMILGSLLIVGALGLTVYNIYDEGRATKRSEDILEKLNEYRKTTDVDRTHESYTPDYVLDPEMDMPVVTFNQENCVGTLEIPVFGLVLPILNDVTPEMLKYAPGVYDGTAYLDNLILGGHNYRNHFGPISSLQSGDTVIFTDLANNVFVYSVLYMEILDGSASEELKAGDWDLTLFTCTLDGRSRYTIRCKRVES